MAERIITSAAERQWVPREDHISSEDQKSRRLRYPSVTDRALTPYESEIADVYAYLLACREGGTRHGFAYKPDKFERHFEDDLRARLSSRDHIVANHVADRLRIWTEYEQLRRQDIAHAANHGVDTATYLQKNALYVDPTGRVTALQPPRQAPVLHTIAGTGYRPPSRRRAGGCLRTVLVLAILIVVGFYFNGVPLFNIIAHLLQSIRR